MVRHFSKNCALGIACKNIVHTTTMNLRVLIVYILVKCEDSNPKSVL